MRVAVFDAVEWPAAASLGLEKQLEMAATCSLLGVEEAVGLHTVVPVVSGGADTKFCDPCTAAEAAAGSMLQGVELMA